MLIKANIKDIGNRNILHPLIRNSSYNHKNTVILDYRLRCRDFKSRVPINFLKDVIMVSEKSFIQNNSFLSNQVRSHVFNTIDNNSSILGVGGESYMYLKNLNNYNNKHFITNNEVIYNDAITNNVLKNFQLDLVNYDNLLIRELFDNAVVNLSKLNVNIIRQLNRIIKKKIIIISCHHNDFWKKSKILSKFRLVKRKKFIDEKLGYFITVNIFVKKS
jgi:hypothetical protein